MYHKNMQEQEWNFLHLKDCTRNTIKMLKGLVQWHALQAITETVFHEYYQTCKNQAYQHGMAYFFSSLTSN